MFQPIKKIARVIRAEVNGEAKQAILHYIVRKHNRHPANTAETEDEGLLKSIMADAVTNGYDIGSWPA